MEDSVSCNHYQIHANPFKWNVFFWDAAIHPALYGMKLEVGGFVGDDSW
jgi:hypothetical protein